MTKILGITWGESVPAGKIFKGERAEKIIADWKDEQQIVLRKQGSFIDAAKRVETRLVGLTGEISSAAKEVKKAHNSFETVKTPVAQARWARRLLLANELHTYTRTSHQMLSSAVERIKDAIEDGRLVVKMIDSQIKDAQLYYEINGQVQLVGKALAAARNQHIMPELQYQNLESSIEQVEATLAAKSDDEIIAEAKLMIDSGLETEVAAE